MYSKKDIMKRAWNLYKNSRMGGYAACTYPSFAECLKRAWAIAKESAKVEAETVRYFNEVCKGAIENGEDAVDEAFRAWRNCSERSDDNSEIFKAHMRAWKAAVAVFRNIMPAFGTEIVDSHVMSQIQNLEIA